MKQLWVTMVTVLVVGCASSDESPPPTVFNPGNFPSGNSGPPRICGVVAGSACEGNGEITRCLCGSFEEQIGRFVCCRDGVAVAGNCTSAKTVFDCDGNRAAGVADAAPAD